MSTANSAMDEEVEGNILPGNPQADAQIGEPHQHVHNVLEEMKKSQEKLLDQVKNSQQRLQQKVEDTICKGLEGITTIRYGAQAREYHQETLQERELMRSEILGEVTDAISTNSDKTMEVVQATYRKVMESTSKNLHEMTTAVDGLAQTIANQREQTLLGFNTAIQEMSKVITNAFSKRDAQKETTRDETTLVGGNQPQRESRVQGSKESPSKSAKPKQSYHRQESSASSEESEFELVLSDSEDDQSVTVQRTRSTHSANGGGHKSNIPPYTGKETWKVWFTRFKDIAKRQGWSDEDKLDVLLPKLQGEAGSFVYDQLSSRVRNNYKLLKVELKNRFRQVENPKTYSAAFAARKQRANETVEGFAAELKKIYDKAYARRDPRTREEDLLRKFLDGLQDTKAACHVEFIKDPKNIDTAVDEVINFQEVHRKQGRTTRRIDFVTEPSGYQSSDEEYEYMIGRTAGRPQKVPVTPNRKENPAGAQELESQIAKMTKQLEEFKGSANQQERPGMDRPMTGPPGNFHPFYGPMPIQPYPPMWPREPRVQCFKCGRHGHRKRDCPLPDVSMAIPNNIGRNEQDTRDRTNGTPQPKAGNYPGPLQ